MPTISQADVRKQIAGGRVGQLYLILGADEAGKVALAGEFLELVEPELRAFNLDRLYGGETSALAVVDAARTLPMMVPRRVVMLLHAERLLEPKKESEAATRDLEALEEYVKAPVETACVVFVGNLDKRKRLAKLLLSKAVVVECSGPADAVEAARWVKDRVAQEGMAIDARAARLVADRVGPDIARLRTDVERLVLYAAGNSVITAEDVLEVVGPPTSQDNWGVTNAIERGAAADALRELGLAMESGAVPYMILGQLAWFVRTKVPAPRVTAAVEAVFRTDLAIKTSAGDPRALLERLVVELCSR
ncbi:MAG TPA: DNA polymerase III subunit delta [Vicinamibacterales bacterium]|nr:DNA polymerase III subunit delta [Vicinamibacterales bacterium]